MKRFVLYIGTALMSFVVGALAATLWNSHSSRSQRPPAVMAQPVEEEHPLTKQIVSRSLQTRSFRTDKLRKNSNDEIVWRWLKEAIAQYPQNWVKLNISASESYGVVLYPLKELEPMELNHINRELNEKGLPPLAKGKRYLPIDVYQGNIICPSWSGFIDVEEAKLVYFVGESA
jgi:hypothetical protein